MIAIDNVTIKFGQFPNGESNLNYNNIAFSDKSIITLKYESDTDLFNLFILKSYMDSIMPRNTFKLNILYMPYSRMDRANKYYTFNLKYVCNFINAMNFYSVSVWDAHSDVCLALLDRVEEISIIPALVANALSGIENHLGIVLCYPDAGAQKRYSQSFGYPTIVGSKNRNFKDGSIIGMEVNTNGVDLEDKTIIIVDDLCSKGGTFIGIAEALEKYKVRDIILVVAHCENTILDGNILWNADLAIDSPISKVYTTNSIFNKPYVNSQLNITKLI